MGKIVDILNFDSSSTMSKGVRNASLYAIIETYPHLLVTCLNITLISFRMTARLSVLRSMEIFKINALGSRYFLNKNLYYISNYNLQIVEGWKG